MAGLLKKVMRDLYKDKRRAVLTLLAILIGTMSFGIAAFTYQIIPREIIAVYDDVIPPSAALMVNKVDDALIELTEQFNDIAIFEQRAFYNLRAQLGPNQWKPLELYSAMDFEMLKVNKIIGEQGVLQPGTGEVLIERDAVKVAAAGIGDTLTIAFPNGGTRAFPITGTVADITLHPASSHDSVYAYVSHETLLELGLVNNRIDFIVTGEPYDRERILSVSNEYIKLLEQNGYNVTYLDVTNTPGISMHLEEYESGLFLLQIFSFVSFLFGCMIMSNLISSVISGQTRQIGILKGIGASTGKITASYMSALFIVVSVTAAISVTLSSLLAGTVSTALLGIGNMHPADTSIPNYLYAVYGGLALVVPMVIAYFPIRRGVRISVKDAVNDYGVSAAGQGLTLKFWKENGEPALLCARKVLPTFLFVSSKRISRPILLSLRNALRRKRRFMLNAAILSVSGAFFVAVVTSLLSMQSTLSNNLDMWKFDYMFLTTTTYSDNELSEIISNIPHSGQYEDWGSSRGLLKNDRGEITSAYRILSVPDNSAMIEPQLLEGRWIKPDDTNQVVVGHNFLADEAGYSIGDTLVMQIGNQSHEFIIAGAVRDFGTTTIYVSEGAFNQHVPLGNRISNVKLILDTNQRERRVFNVINEALEQQGVLIMQTRSKADLISVAAEHFAVTMQTFLLVIFMLVVISSFGLAATMNTQTSERIKEIGIMKAMGAGKKQIIKIVTAESICIGLISWFVSIILGVPLGLIGVHIFGSMIIETPLEFNGISLLASLGIWLLLTLAIGYYASRACAKYAARMSIKESLMFEG